MADASVKPARDRSKLIGSGFGLGCAFGCFLLMAREGQTRHASVYGMLLLFGAIAGFLAAIGSLGPASADAITLRQTSLYALPDERRWAAPIVTVPIALIALAVLGFGLGWTGLPIAIAAALLVLFVSALRRPALLVFVIGSALYLPLLGHFGLWDPWETHYGEVSREILSRDDWISLWWAQDRWFWSKPILIFWMEALTWSGSGVHFRADQHPAHTEWVLRLPIFVIAIVGLLALYAGLSKIWNRRAAVLASIVLATMPYYAFLTHQAITDMPFVGTMTVAMMLLILACAEDPERQAPMLRVGRFGLSLQHAVIALILAIALPQLLYLISRNITFVHGLFAWHRDSFLHGSAGNPASVPGNFDLHEERPYETALLCEPIAQALMFGIALAPILWLLRREQRLSSLYMFGFYTFCALAFMAKGIPGFALPGLCALFFLIASGRYQLLLEGRLRVAVGMLTVAVLGMPWFVAMYMRHGPAFTDRILIHDHINRLTSGVHGDNGSIQYFIWQLGYGLFPWVGLVPAALASWLLSKPRSSASRVQRDMLMMLGLWFATSFTLFSAMTTKFHHYIFPAVPPIAAMIGVLLDRLLPTPWFGLSGRALGRTVAGLLAPVPCVLGFAGWHGDVRGVLPSNLKDAAQRSVWIFEHPWPTWLCVMLIIAGVLLFALAAVGGAAPRAPRANLVAAAIAGAVLLAFVGRDLAWNVRDQPPGAERLIHLFVYNYTRPWPDYLDYRAIMFGFAAVAVLWTGACALRRLQPSAASGLVGLGLAFCVFCLDVYMIDLTPHWTQAGLIARYYAERKSKDEPLVAWQMNWKGENFYTGNRVFVFVDLDNKALLDWVGKNAGHHVFFILEHSRLDRLRKLLAPRTLETLTTQRDCNKFVLVQTTL